MDIWFYSRIRFKTDCRQKKKRWRERESAESLRKEITLRLKAVLVRQNKLVWLPCSWIKSLLSKYYNSLGFSVIFFSVMDDTNVF